jgi:hypothetical protein
MQANVSLRRLVLGSLLALINVVGCGRTDLERDAFNSGGTQFMAPGGMNGTGGRAFPLIGGGAGFTVTSGGAVALMGGASATMGG